MSFLSFLFPRCCAGCGQALHGAAGKTDWEYLCPTCAADLRAVGPQVCQRCAVPLYGFLSSQPLCGVCRDHPPAWRQARSLLRYQAAARTWIRAYKYSNARWVEREWQKLFLAPQFADLSNFLAGATLVPVPLHPFKRLLRGFNQSEELAKLLLKVIQPIDCKIDTYLLRRTRYTRQQARLGRGERLKNVKNAFALHPRADLQKLKDQRIVLIDDLLTTGATLTACAKVLNDAGAPKVDVLTLGRG